MCRYRGRAVSEQLESVLGRMDVIQSGNSEGLLTIERQRRIENIYQSMLNNWAKEEPHVELDFIVRKVKVTHRGKRSMEACERRRQRFLDKKRMINNVDDTDGRRCEVIVL